MCVKLGVKISLCLVYCKLCCICDLLCVNVFLCIFVYVVYGVGVLVMDGQYHCRYQVRVL